jgi:RNA polymerase sigma factor (sigma-70 family)
VVKRREVEEELTLHIAGLRRYAIALTGNRHEAEDLLQEALARAIAAAASYRASGSLRAWLFSIMHNAFISGLRERRPVDEPEGIELSTPAPQLAALEVRDVLAALARLPEPQRAALSLIALEEFSYEEAAAILGIPLGTLMSRLARGREALRRTLAGEAPPRLRVVGGKS